jgi:hypothetical protein
MKIAGDGENLSSKTSLHFYKTTRRHVSDYDSLCSGSSFLVFIHTGNHLGLYPRSRTLNKIVVNDVELLLLFSRSKVQISAQTWAWDFIQSFQAVAGIAP